MTRTKAWVAVTTLLAAALGTVTWTAVLWAGRANTARAPHMMESVADPPQAEAPPPWHPGAASAPVAVQPTVQNAPRAVASAASRGTDVQDPPRPTIFDGLSKEAGLARADEYFRADPVDAKWARQTASDVREKLDKAAAELKNAKNSTVDSVECRSSACKVSMHFSDRDAQRDYFVKALFGHTMTMPSMAHVVDGTDSVGGVAYLFKDAFPSE